MSFLSKLIGYMSTIIQFKDINVKEALLASSDINPDGTREITYTEAKNSSITGAMLKAALNPNEASAPNTDIVSFDELQYFENVASLPTGFLSGCSNLKSIKFPYGILGAGDGYDLLKNTDIEEIDVNTATLYGASGPSGALTGSKSLFGPLSTLKIVWIDKVTNVVARAFRKEDQPNIEKVIISSVSQWLNIVVNSTVNQKPDCMPTVSGKASLYIGSPDGQKVTVINTTGITTLRDHLFAGIQDIAQINIEEDGTSVGINCFNNINSGNEFILTGYHKITSIANGAFINCNAGNALDDVPPLATSIQSCFTGSSLQKATSSVLKSVGSTCFRNSKITTVDLPLGEEITPGVTPTITQIINGYQSATNQGVFQGCKSLVSVKLVSLPIVTNYMFQGCTALTQAKLDSITKISQNAFAECSSLELLNAPNVKQLEYRCFYGCKAFAFIKTSSYTPPDLTETVEEIGELCFYCSGNDGSPVQVPYEFKKLAIIHDGAFESCIPPSEGYVIFRKSDSIVTFVPINSINPDQKYRVNLFGESGPKTIYVPDALVPSYEADTEWANMINKGFTFLPISQLPA